MANPKHFMGIGNISSRCSAASRLGSRCFLGRAPVSRPLTWPSRDKAEGAKILGAIASAMTVEDLSKTITKTRIGETGFAVLLDENNCLTAHGNGKIKSEFQDLSSHPALRQWNRFDRDSFVFEEDGKKVVAYTKKDPTGLDAYRPAGQSGGLRACQRGSSGLFFPGIADHLYMGDTIFFVTV